MGKTTIQQAFDSAVEHHQNGRLHEAEQLYKQVLGAQPGNVDALRYLGLIAHQVGRNDVAEDLLRRAISLKPNFTNAYVDLGMVLWGKGKSEEAIAAYRQAIAIDPGSGEAHNNLGNTLKELGRVEEAIAVFRRAVALNPELSEAHYNLSLALLLNGEFQEGWSEYEWRWKCKLSRRPRGFREPQWDGSRLEGRTILLYTQQGFGDAIQFVRYLPMVAERGGKVVVECKPEVERLFRTMGGDFQLVVRGDPLPAFDVHCSLVSLPWILGTNLSNIPGNVPYLSADAGLRKAWEQRLGPRDGLLRVGLAWAGNPGFRGDRRRSLSLKELLPLAAVRDAQFYSLQKGPAGEQAKNPPVGFEVVDLGPELSDFADTAAAMSQMDLIISSDTSIPHLAGALGLPVWLMLQFVPSFRWLLEREDSPWYPTMRLFRQRRLGDWGEVVGRVAAELGMFRDERLR